MKAWKIFLFLVNICITNLVLGQDFSRQTQVFRNQLNGKIPDTARIKLQLDFARFYLYAGIRNPKYLDSARLQQKQAVALTQHLHLRNWYSQCLELEGLLDFETANPQNGLHHYEESIKNQGLKDDYKIAGAWVLLADNIPTIDSSFCEAKATAYARARAIYLSLNDPLNEATALKNEADARLCQGKLVVAETELIEVLKRLKAINYRNLHHTYYLLGAINHLKGDLRKELYYCLETVKSMEATGDTAPADLFYTKLAVVYNELGMTQNSIYYFRKAFSYSKKNSSRGYFSLEYIVQLLVKENKKTEALSFFRKNFNLPHIHKSRIWCLCLSSFSGLLC